MRSFGEKKPMLGAQVYVDEAATVIGEVHLHDGASVWPGAVIRADSARVDIGRNSAMMDVSFAEAPKGRPVVVGDRCIISHGALLHGCVVVDDCLVGIGAIVLDEAHIGAGSVIAAGSLIPPGTKIQPGSFVMGVPGRVIRETKEADMTYLRAELRALAEKASAYRAGVQAPI